jgi:hypothetical protein
MSDCVIEEEAGSINSCVKCRRWDALKGHNLNNPSRNFGINPGIEETHSPAP